MVKIGLQLKADFENIVNLVAEGEDFRWYLKLKCLGCGEVSDKFQYVTLDESSPLKGGRGSANLVTKCKFCSRENSIDIIKESIKPVGKPDEKQPGFQSIVSYDCRGIEPVEFSPRVGWSAESAESGKKFTNIDLTENEWADYDENAQLSVGIYDLQYQFVKEK